MLPFCLDVLSFQIRENKMGVLTDFFLASSKDRFLLGKMLAKSHHGN
jgi:hypothetical protein